MKAERRVSLVIGYEPAFGKPPADVAAAGLTATLAAVLSTFRSDSADSVRDHALWLACARAITEAVAADNVEVYGEAPNGVVNRLLRKRVGIPLGTLAAYAAQLSSHVDPPDWAFIRWKRDGILVARGHERTVGPSRWPRSVSRLIHHVCIRATLGLCPSWWSTFVTASCGRAVTLSRWSTLGAADRCNNRLERAGLEPAAQPGR